MNSYKTFFILVIVIMFEISFQSCNNDSPTSNTNNSNSSLVNSLGGLVNNITATSRYMKAIVGEDTIEFIAGTDSVGSDNIFNLSLINPPASALKNLNALFPSGASVSNSEALGNFLSVGAFNNNGGLIDGRLVNSNIPPNNTPVTGDYLLFYMYCDRNVNVSGSFTNIISSDTLVYNYNMVFEAGYNKFKRVIISQRSNYTEYELKNGGSENTNWYYINVVENSGFNVLGIK